MTRSLIVLAVLVLPDPSWEGGTGNPAGPVRPQGPLPLSVPWFPRLNEPIATCVTLEGPSLSLLRAGCSILEAHLDSMGQFRVGIPELTPLLS